MTNSGCACLASGFWLAVDEPHLGFTLDIDHHYTTSASIDNARTTACHQCWALKKFGRESVPCMLLWSALTLEGPESLQSQSLISLLAYPAKLTVVQVKADKCCVFNMTAHGSSTRCLCGNHGVCVINPHSQPALPITLQKTHWHAALSAIIATWPLLRSKDLAKD